MVKVLKKNKKKQAFSSAKIRKSIVLAASRTKMSAAKARRIAARVAKHISAGMRGKATVRSANIRRATLAHLRREARPIAKSWVVYDKKKR